MSLFDLLLLAMVLAAVATLILAALLAVRGRRPQALKLLRGYRICAGTYLAVVIVVSPFVPRRVLKVGEVLCFDDWCIAVQDVSRTPEAPVMVYAVTLQLSSRARGVPQRENGLALYLTDKAGNRYDPVSKEGEGPLNVLLQPQQAATARRVFYLPAGANEVGLVIAHEGFPIRWFILGEGPFRKPPLVKFE